MTPAIAAVARIADMTRLILAAALYAVCAPAYAEDQTCYGSGASWDVSGVREFVESEKFRGKDIAIWVSSGWLRKDFVIKGETEEVESVCRAIGEVFGAKP